MKLIKRENIEKQTSVTAADSFLSACVSPLLIWSKHLSCFLTSSSVSRREPVNSFSLALTQHDAGSTLIHCGKGKPRQRVEKITLGPEPNLPSVSRLSFKSLFTICVLFPVSKRIYK